MPEDSTSLNDLLPLTPEVRAERLAERKRLFPDLFTNEGRLDPDELRRLVEPGETRETERYEFKWYGKAASKREAFTPTTATLVYDEARSVNPEKADGNMIIEGENLESLKLLLNAYREQAATRAAAPSSASPGTRTSTRPRSNVSANSRMPGKPLSSSASNALSPPPESGISSISSATTSTLFETGKTVFQGTK